MAFDMAAVNDVFDRVRSHALSLGLFEQVNNHEPKNKPGNGLTAAVWIDSMRPVRSSGLAFTSGQVVLNVRVYQNFIAEPYDMIDPRTTYAVSQLMAAYSGDFTLGGTAREIDLLGIEGTELGAQAGYVTIGGTVYRVITLTVPVVINDLWLQSGTVTDGEAQTSTLTVDNLVVNDSVTVGGRITSGVVALTDAATIALDASGGDLFTVTLGGDRTLANPTNPADGQRILVEVTQDGTGGRTLAFGTGYEFTAALPSPALSVAAGAVDYLAFIYRAGAGKWRHLAFAGGY